MYGLKEGWEFEEQAQGYELADYVSNVPRWCSGCGDHGVLGALQRLARDEQLPPEKTVIVSGIGCSSRFPHYMKTFGFHGLHGRPFPVAQGVRSRRPDLHIFVVTGDGDCCAIGTAHWIHAIRYNMRMTVMMLDNNIYGLTKMQSSPTTPQGHHTHTHPRGTLLPPLNPLSVTLGVTNVSFVAQSVDWNPPHVYATLRAAHRHPGFSFVRILQRCPHFMPHLWDDIQRSPESVALLKHENGIQLEAQAERAFKNQIAHDPSDMRAARDLAERTDTVPIGLLYADPRRPCYDDETARGLRMAAADKVQHAQAAIDEFNI